MQYVYPCNLTHDVEEGEGYVVTFPDVPEAITGARTREESPCSGRGCSGCRARRIRREP